MKRFTLFLVAIILLVSISMPSQAAVGPAFVVKIDGTLDSGTPFNGQDTLVLDWLIMSNKEEQTLRYAQGLRLVYDNTVLQLMK